MPHYEAAPSLAIPTAETVAVTLGSPPGLGSPPIAGQVPAAPIVPTVINGVVNFTGGASTTAVQVKCRQGQATTTGAQVGSTQTHTLAASASANIPFEFYDAVGSATGWTITFTAVGAAGTLNTYSVDYNLQ